MKRGCALAILWLAILSPFCVCVFALDPSLDISQYAHTAWRVRDGFTTSTINPIAQTPDGYLWLGTEFGLVKFDGVHAALWEPPANQHLPAGIIRSLLVARDGRLWIGSTSGLASLKDSTLTQYRDFDREIVFALLEDRDGTVWAGTGGAPSAGKLCAIRDRAVHCVGGDGRFGAAVAGLYEDSRGNLWASVPNGLWKWKPGSQKFYALPGEPDGPAIAEDENDVLVVGWKGTIYRLLGGKMERYPLLGISGKFRARTIIRARNGELWIGLWNRGLVHVHEGKTDLFSARDGLSGEDVHALFEDREGNVWVSTIDGLDRFRDFAVATLRVKQGLLRNLVGSVLADKNGTVWFSTYGGLNRSARGKITVPPIGAATKDGKVNGFVPNSLFEDNRGRIWISTMREMGYLDDSRFTAIRGATSGNVLSMVEDTLGNLWVVNEPVGLVRISPQHDVRKIPWAELGHKDNASVLAADRRRGGLWMGFFLGSIAYFSDGHVRESYSAADGLGTGRVSDLFFDNERTLWISTEGGLSRLKNDRLATLTSKNGLPCDTVHWAIEDDDRAMWLYTACGLVRIARSELNAWSIATDTQANRTYKIQVSVFDNSDGVRILNRPGHFHPLVAKSSGRLWFLPSDGVSVIDPRHIPFNNIQPPVRIEKITADDKSYPLSNGVQLPARIRNLDIDYTALSLVVPEKVRFRVKLEGQDKDWRELVNVRHVEYTNLPPKHYRFRVLACNNSGVWNEAGTFLDFSIAPAYYQTWWFRSVCVLAFLAMVYGAYRVRVGQLRAQEKKFREAIESIPTMAFVSLPDGYRTFVNKGWVEYTGMTVEQSMGSGWHTVIHQEDLKRVLGEWEAALVSGKSMYYEARYRRGEDGQYRWFMVRVVPQRNKHGKIVKWFGTLTDVEDRKRAEESLRSSEAYLVEAQSLTQTGSCAIDGSSHETVYWSDEMFRLFGFDPQQGPPMFDQWLERIHPEDRDKVKLANERTFLNRVSCDLEFRIVKPDGAVKYIHGVGHPVLSPTGELVQVVGTMVDITERKRAEEAREKLRQLEADLAHINRVSTLGEMAASLAHEIKQPIAATITSANSCLEWLAHEPPNLDRARAAVARIDKYGNRAAEIIDRIRSFYKKSASQRELVDVNGIIEEILALLKCEADRYSVAMRTELAAELPKITADRVQLQQVFMNLMLNAIQAMTDSGGELIVRSQRQDSQILFSVIDTGVGLPKEKMDQIFSAFFTTKPQGSGMGLSISRSIVESQGGRLWASANDGPGATFHFSLPIATHIVEEIATGT
jgi:PAS domain S-box-containing protein